MPHLTSLQKEYGGKVTFLSVSVWERDQSSVGPFVKRMRDKMVAHVAMDTVPKPTAGHDLAWAGDNGNMSQSWLHASGEYSYGIPRSMIVGRDGRIGWMGPPSGLDVPLAKIVGGTWDFAAERKRELIIATKLASLIDLRAKYDAAVTRKNYTEAIGLCGKLIMLDPKANSSYAAEKFCILLTKVDNPMEANSYAVDALRLCHDDGYALWKIGAAVLDLTRPLSDREKDVAMAAATRANELGGGTVDWYLDLLARANAQKGDYASAVSLEEAAVQHARPSNVKSFTATLEGYKKLRNGGKLRDIRAVGPERHRSAQVQR